MLTAAAAAAAAAVPEQVEDVQVPELSLVAAQGHPDGKQSSEEALGLGPAATAGGHVYVVVVDEQLPGQ